MALNLILIALLCLTIAYSIHQNRKTCRSIDRLLDCVLNQQEITCSDIREGNLSALVNKIQKIQEVLGGQVEMAREEKEQVKSLVSNMSHQLKTPLANLSLYTEILDNPNLKEEEKKQVQAKLKRQVEKLDWLTSSLLKMVKLEQNVISFDAKDQSIKETIQDAVEAVYQKMEQKNIRFTADTFSDFPLYHNRKWTAEVFVNWC